MVSIIIVNYNTYQLTCNCINSIIKYTNQVAYEIVLVDNASVETQSKIFSDLFGTKIKFIQSNKNLGFAGGNNLGIEHANGDYILLLNSDTELFEDSIAKTYKFIESKNKVGAATCKLLNPDKKSLQNAARPFFSLKIHFLKSFGLDKLFASSLHSYYKKYDLTQSFETDWIWGTFFMFPKKNLSLMGGRLTENFFMYSEDVEWSYLFNKNDLHNYYYADTAIIHYGGQSSPTKQRLKLIEQSHIKFVRMYYGYATAFFEYLLFRKDALNKRVKRIRRRLKQKFIKEKFIL